MTKTPFSVNDAARPQSSRRALLRTLAIAPVAVAAGAGTGTMIAKAAEGSPDAELIALCDQWKALQQASDAAWTDLSRRIDRAEPNAPEPEAVFVRDGDGTLPRWYAEKGPGGRQWYPSTNLERLRKLHLPSMPSFGNARLREIVTAHDEWNAAIRAAVKAAGVPEAQARCEAIDREAGEIARSFAPMPARTLQGIIAKVEVAVMMNGGLDDLELDLQYELHPDKVISNETLAFVILRDLARMNGEG